MKKARSILIVVSVLLAFSSGVRAQAWPQKPIRLIVPYAAGGAGDVTARLISTEVAKIVKQPIVIENKLGAGGTIAAAQVARSEPDGYTILIHSSGHALNPVLYPNLGYDTVKDLTGVTTLAAISPGKTWEGVSGALFAVTAYFLVLHFWAPEWSPVFRDATGWVVMLAIAVLGIEGDLFESWMKRRAGVKDSGTMLPGHGGVLDRIDALTAGMPAAALAMLLYR